ncbi:hypothetical protein AVEN_210982-1 [Araneus ventricosus]|uniref:HTH psq-type domain-containing protein n=1 Tax=Araneus ventricosus TaxID=182803 RepID=A0A4Y2QUU0_ARAVE|nr:hypothetical protein AVEN_210982-1 [Araneus ventricosus]
MHANNLEILSEIKNRCKDKRFTQLKKICRKSEGRYQRKTDRQSWSQESMAGAIQEVLEGNMGYRRASKAYSVPQKEEGERGLTEEAVF